MYIEKPFIKRSKLMRYLNPKTLAYERLSWWMNHKPSIVMYDVMQSKHFVSTMKFLKSFVGFYVDKKEAN